MIQVNKKLLFFIIAVLTVYSSCKKEDTSPANETDGKEPISYEFKPIISNLYPTNESIDIDVRFQPSIKFHEWTPEYQEEYKMVIDYILLEQNNIELDFTEEWNTEKDSLLIIPTKRFEPDANIKLAIKTHWEVLKNDIWSIPDSAYYEERELVFSTKLVSAEKIEADNVEYSYPLANQYHFLKDEYDKGFIKLIAAQDELFESNNFSGNSKFVAQITNPDGFSYEAEVSYESSYIEFNMPDNLENEKIYKLEILKQKDSQSSIIYTIHFRTSMFNTAQDKYTCFDNQESVSRYYVSPGVHYIYSHYLTLQEYFDVYELKKIDGLVRFEMDSTTLYYKHFIYPLIYKNIEKTEISAFNSSRIEEIKTAAQIDNVDDIDIYQVFKYPPLKSLNAFQYISGFETPYLTNGQIESNNAPRAAGEGSWLGIRCFFNQIAYYDYYAMKNWLLTNYGKDNIPDWGKVVFDNDWTTFSKGDYLFRLKYTLPDGTVTYEKELLINLEFGLEINEIRID